MKGTLDQARRIRSGSVRAADAGRLATLTGRFAVVDGIIGTAVALALK